MQVLDEFERYAAVLEDFIRETEQTGVTETLKRIEDACDDAGKSWSGSWLGYHSRVYYQGLENPPAGANFSQEWGLKDQSYSDMGSVGYWAEYPEEQVTQFIYDQSNAAPDDSSLTQTKQKAKTLLEQYKFEALSCFESTISVANDTILRQLRTSLEDLKPNSTSQILQALAPVGQIFTRDTLALGQGLQAPPHLKIKAKVFSTRLALQNCEKLAGILRKACKHIKRKERGGNTDIVESAPIKVFVGHGRSTLWRELKDFLEDRLKLQTDEFNRVPVAGVPNTERLFTMMNEACFAFLVLTAEDETSDGKLQPRMNVIHEVGLFQGKLGFSKAIVLLEEGCEEFSNINGLGQIRFPKGQISAKFEEIRQVLEREGIVH